MKEVAVDSNVVIAALLEEDEHHHQAINFVEELKARNMLFHASMLVPVEVCGVIIRRTKSPTRAYLIKREMEIWEREGYIKLYPVDKERMVRAEEISLKDEMKGHDAIIAGVAEELGVAILTFDEEMLKRFKGRIEPSA